MFCFFFSSRRRHTRYWRDWSSDVCSSDLKRLDRIEIGGAIGGVETEADPDGRADKETGKRPAVRENYVHLEPRCEQIASDDSENDSQNTASLGNENGLGQELPQNIVATGTDRFADADFLCAFGHAHQHDVHDADSCRDQGDETYDERAHSDISRDVNKCALERVVAVNLEIVRLVRA